jgi:hypothetical protein
MYTPVAYQDVKSPAQDMIIDTGYIMWIHLLKIYTGYYHMWCTRMWIYLLKAYDSRYRLLSYNKEYDSNLWWYSRLSTQGILWCRLLSYRTTSMWDMIITRYMIVTYDSIVSYLWCSNLWYSYYHRLLSYILLLCVIWLIFLLPEVTIIYLVIIISHILV